MKGSARPSTLSAETWASIVRMSIRSDDEFRFHTP
jgi:hypothetical protein